MIEYNIDGHTIEFSSGSSGLDPWTLEYCHKIGLSCFTTADIISYIRIDGEYIYSIRNGNRAFEMKKAVDEGSVSNFDEFMFFFKEFFEEKYPTYSESVKRHDEIKKEEDAYNAMTPEEKKKYMEEWRARRDENIRKRNEKIKSETE